ncbi:MAG: hypothetical protein EBS49_08980, partial [Verrucomicrobia bacterium]|nr:hypothetical protein [Verrucomicrobiota bacterium]
MTNLVAVAAGAGGGGGAGWQPAGLPGLTGNLLTNGVARGQDSASVSAVPNGVDGGAGGGGGGGWPNGGRGGGVSVFKTGEYYGLGGSAGANWTNGLVDARAVYVPNSGNAMGSISFGVDLLISGVIQTSNSGDGFGGIVKNGQGTMALSAQNTYTGGTIVSAGKLILGGMENDGVGAIRGTLTVNEGAVVDYTQTMNDIYNGSHSFGWK